MRCPRCSNAMDEVVACSDGAQRRAAHCFMCGYTKGIVGLRQSSGVLGHSGSIVAGATTSARVASAAAAEARGVPGRSVVTPPIIMLGQWLRALLGLSWFPREPRLVFRCDPRTGAVEFAAADAVPLAPNALRVSWWRLLFPSVVFE